MADYVDILGELRKLVETAIIAPLSPLSIDRIQGRLRKDDLLVYDHIQYNERYGGRNKKYYTDRHIIVPSHRKSALSTQRDEHVFSRLGHIIVNPHDSFNTDALVKSYVFATEYVNDEEEGFVANANKKAAKRFMKSLIEAAKYQSDIRQKRFNVTAESGNHSPFFVLHGSRGSGKTFFQNYLLSKWSDYLDSEKIIWVRINLTELTSYDENLSGLITAQAAKIIARYYDKGSRYFDQKKDRAKTHIDCRRVLDDFVQARVTLGSRAKTKLIDHSVKMIEIFHRGGHPTGNIRDEKLSPNIVNDSIANELWGAAAEAGYSFVVILDGVDVLEATSVDKERFRRIKRQLSLLRSADEPLGYAMVVCSRTTTVDGELSQDTPDPFVIRGNPKAFRVAPVPLKAVIDARVEYIDAEVRSIVEKRAADWSLRDWEEHVSDFHAYMNGRAVRGLNTHQAYIKQLEEIQWENLRSKMQIVQFSYYEFLQYGRRRSDSRPGAGGRGYHVIEALLKAGKRFPSIPYSYKADESGHWVRVADKRGFDSRFLPSVFRTPFSYWRFAQAKEEKVLPQYSCLNNAVMGLRMLQFIEAGSKLVSDGRRTGQPFERLRIWELCHLLSNLFGYDRETTVLIIEEWVEFQLVELENKSVYSISDLNAEQFLHNEIIPLPKITYILNNLLAELTYLNMAGMRLVLSADAFAGEFGYSASEATDRVPFVRAAAYDEHSDHIEDWMGAKIVNPISICRLITHMDECHRRLFQQRIQDLKSRRLLRVASAAEQQGMFNTGERVRPKIVQAADLALNGLTNFEEASQILGYVRDDLEAYIRVWG